MKLDDLLPQRDVETVQREVIDAEPARVYVVAIEADLARAAHRGRAVAALMAARATPTRLGRALRRRPAPAADPVRLESLPEPGEWVKLDEDFGREFVFGAVGRVGSRSIRWRQIHRSEFAGFSEPGHARVAANLSLRPDGGGRTVLSFELRAQATDPETPRRLTRYWRFAAPLVSQFMRGLLRYVKAEAERGYSSATPPPSRAASSASSRRS
jgi:hypothetical protein